MNKIIKTGIILCTIFFLGCDMFHTKSEVLVGDLNLINPRTQGDNGYSLVLVEGTGVNKNILPEYVETIFGNDTILAAKCRSEDEETNLFYKILHNKGHNPISSIRITSQEYSQLQESLLIKYSFSSNSYSSMQSGK